MRNIRQALQQELAALKEQGLYKEERIITTPQSASIDTTGQKEVLNFCANNYLGLSSHPDVLEAAKDTLDAYGFGMSSVRFICGTQDIHKTLESKIASWVGTEDAILYAAAFDANGGLFEPLLGKEDAIISDQLNHASIIDGIRLCKAERHRYLNNDMADLEEKLKATQHCRRRLIATDGVFSMDGIIAQIDKICDLAEKYDALVMLDDCHSTGFIGKSGRGTAEHCGAFGRVDIITGTFGKALGGASGGFTAARRGDEGGPRAVRSRAPWRPGRLAACGLIGARHRRLPRLRGDRWVAWGSRVFAPRARVARSRLRTCGVVLWDAGGCWKRADVLGW